MGATENSPIHPCEARHSGKTSATARQITNRTTSAAESPHPRAMMSSGLFADVRVFMASSIWWLAEKITLRARKQLI
jgi:hypothetical protein